MSSKFLFLKINANITSLFSVGHNLKLCNIWHLVNQDEKKKQIRLSNDHFDKDVCRFEGLPQHGHDNNVTGRQHCRENN